MAEMNSTITGKTKVAGKNKNAEAAGKTVSTTKRGSVVSRAARGLVGSMLRRVDIQSASVESGTTGPLNIGRIEVDGASVQTITLAGLRTKVKTGEVLLDDVRAIMQIRLRVDWWVWNPFGRNFGDDFSINLPAIPFDFEDVTIPELDNIEIQVDDAQIRDSTAIIQPISSLTFNGGVVSDIALQDIRLPSEGYAVAGLSFDAFELSHFGVVDASIGKLTIGEFTPDGLLTLPSTRINNIGLGDVDVPKVRSTQPVVVQDARAIGERIPLVSAGIAGFGIRLEPTMMLHIRALTLNDIKATVTIDDIHLQNIRFPLSVRDIEIDDVKIDGIRANQISL